MIVPTHTIRHLSGWLGERWGGLLIGLPISPALTLSYCLPSWKSGRWGVAAKPHRPDGAQAPGLRARLVAVAVCRRPVLPARRFPMTAQTSATRRKPECTMSFHVER